MARTISAAIWCRRVGSLGQNRGGLAEESQPLITPRAARASIATQAGSEAGTSPKRVPQGPVEGEEDGDGLAEGEGLLDGEGLVEGDGEGLGGAGVYSTAPMSQPVPTAAGSSCGRVKPAPRWS